VLIKPADKRIEGASIFTPFFYDNDLHRKPARSTMVPVSAEAGLQRAKIRFIGAG